MRTRAWSLLLVPFLLLSMSASAQTFVATLNGANEAPGPGDPDGAGFATVTFVGTTVNYSIVVTNITLPPIGQHIHIGGPGVPGPIVVNLPGTWVGNTLNGSTTSDPATIAAIVANPGGYYVNVHTTDFPGGAVRGQLTPFGSAAGGVPTLSFAGMLALAAGLALIGIFVARSV